MGCALGPQLRPKLSEFNSDNKSTNRNKTKFVTLKEDELKMRIAKHYSSYFNNCSRVFINGL